MARLPPTKVVCSGGVSKPAHVVVQTKTRQLEVQKGKVKTFVRISLNQA